jgi:anti-sigma factor RsiW
MSTLGQQMRFAFDHHRVPGQMSAYLDAELGARGRTRVERHTARCPPCRRLLGDLRQTVALLRAQSLAREPAPAQLVSAVRARLREPGG